MVRGRTPGMGESPSMEEVRARREGGARREEERIRRRRRSSQRRCATREKTKTVTYEEGLQQLISSPHRSPSRRSLSHHHDSRQSSPNRTPGDAVWSLISPPLQLIAVGLPVAGPCLIRFSPVLIESHSQRRCLVSPSSAHLSSLLLCLSGLDGSVSDLRRIFG
ncbi:hypothetical protein HN51_003274, partial [Arachis hypogaea]